MKSFLFKQRRDPVTCILEWIQKKKWERKFPDLKGMDWVSKKTYDRDVEKARPQRVRRWCEAHGWEYYDEDSNGNPVKINVQESEDSDILIQLLKNL